MKKLLTKEKICVMRLVLMVVGLCFVFQTGLYPQTIKTQDHPNHYILLIDASASIVANKLKVQTYQQALKQKLLNGLYENGFGESIPPMDPQKDFLTLFHFGIIPKRHVTPGVLPYSILKNYKLPDNYIHSRFIFKSNITKEELMGRPILADEPILPDEFYNLTLLTWSKYLALMHLKSTPVNGEVVRTFFIVIHDGILNAQLLSEDMSMVDRWGNPGDARKIKEFNRLIDNDYVYLDNEGNPIRKGNPEYLFQQSLGTQNQPIFLEAYELASQKQKNWEVESKNIGFLKNFGTVEMHWIKETGNNPEGIIKVNFAQPFYLHLGPGSSFTVDITYETDKFIYQGIVQPFVEFPVRFSSKLPCDPLMCRVLFDFSTVHYDAILGKRTVSVCFDINVESPKPLNCTMGYIFKIIAAILGIVFLVAIILTYCYFRFISTNIRIEFPGLTFPLIIKRIPLMEGRIPNTPAHDMSPFLICLPPRWLQFLLYRNAKIILNFKDYKYFYWKKGSENQEIIKMPVRDRKINIFWKAVPVKHTPISILFIQGKLSTKIRLYFPGGSSQGGENE
ncbi:MAG: hypothetical protein NT166_06305 [Candidatus Aminicenantes bacterium]|nr:hypothetical protein [Candidatus Aminicenantes bacterium]